MPGPEFDIRIGKDGKVTVQVKGVSGAKCLALADLIKEIVGHEESRKLTTEYYAPESQVRIDVDVKNQR